MAPGPGLKACKEGAVPNGRDSVIRRLGGALSNTWGQGPEMMSLFKDEEEPEEPLEPITRSLSSSERARLSKAMSAHLRHRGPPGMRADGFAPLRSLSKVMRVAPNMLLDIAQFRPGEKARFELRQGDHGRLWIRAMHGHSDPRIQEDLLMDPILEPLGKLLHATYAHCVPSILETGLKSIGRRHVHFVASDDPDSILMGFRKECDRLIYVDMAGALSAGVRFYRAPDGMVLSPGSPCAKGEVGPQFIVCVRARDEATGCVKDLLWPEQPLEGALPRTPLEHRPLAMPMPLGPVPPDAATWGQGTEDEIPSTPSILRRTDELQPLVGWETVHL